MSTPQKTETVTLLKPHRHAGRDYPAGAVLDLPADSASWLVGIKVAEKTVTAAGGKIKE